MTLDRTTPPPTTGFDKLTMPPCEVINIGPNVKLWLINSGSQPANRISIYWHRGLSAAASDASVSVLTMMMREGCASMSGAEIADTIDYNGAWMGANNSMHYSGISLLSLNDTTESLLPLLCDMAKNPTFPVNALESTRQRLIAAKQLSQSKVDRIASNELNKLICGASHPYLLDLTIPQLDAISRERLIQEYVLATKHTDVNVFVAGCLTKSLIAGIERLAFALQPQDTSAVIKVVPMPHYSPTTKYIPTVAASNQAAIACAIPTIDRSHPDYDELRHVVIALGGYFGCRLMSNIREEKGLTYGISAALNGSREGSYISISAQCDNSYCQTVIEQIAVELRKLATQPMPDDELTRLKNNIISGLAQQLDTPFAINDYYESLLTVGIEGDYFARRFETIKNLTTQRIMELASRYLKPELMTIIVCHRSD